jgi:hypothetical protein
MFFAVIFKLKSLMLETALLVPGYTSVVACTECKVRRFSKFELYVLVKVGFFVKLMIDKASSISAINLHNIYRS